jgi:DNA-damage-inducible protein J
MGLTVADAVRILLTRTANEGMLPLELVSNSQAYDSWFREKVRQALADTGPNLDDSEVEANFAQRRAAALREAAEHER